MSLFRGQRRWYEVITMHWSYARARLADESHITRIGGSMVRLLGYDSRLSEESTGAELNRHDDVERTSPVLGTGATMH